MWVEEYNITTRTVEAFNKLLENYKSDDPDVYAEVMKGIDVENLTYYVQTVPLNLGNWPDCDYNTISASMSVYHDKKRLQTVRLFTCFQGKQRMIL